MRHSITSKGEAVSFGSQEKKNKTILHGHFLGLLLEGLLCNFVYTCWRRRQEQKNTAGHIAVVPTPFVFSTKWHPSKLMGCNHHHKYTATRPTARSWVFNSQSMGCKEWQAWGTQFPISLTTLSENRERIQKTLPVFRFRRWGWGGGVREEEKKKSPLFAEHLWGPRG